MNDVVLGLQGTVDYELEWDAGILERVAAEYGLTTAHLDSHTEISDERSLVRALLAFLRDGTGGERFVASSAIVEQFAARFTNRITLGGTCVRAALAMRIRDVPALLHLVSTDDHTRRLLPPDTAVITSATHDTLDPHLIVQYPQGARVRVGRELVVTPHPNRVIFANDPPARNLVLSPELGERLADARIFLISGLNSIQEPDILESRLRELRDAVSRMPARSVVMFEEAGYHRADFAQLVRTAMSQLVDVHSMNEDELQQRLARTIDLLDADQVDSALQELREAAPGIVHVVHTKYWSIAAGPGASHFAGALAGGVDMASTRYLHGDDMTAADYDAVARHDRHPAGSALVAALADGDEVVGVPAYVLPTDRPVTIGLGDTFVGGFVAALARDPAFAPARSSEVPA
jgi:ADP-dependent phosphofructokinase/glucokinase